jgi:pimeloyl-ACP methyl ester carboxylesterase
MVSNDLVTTGFLVRPNSVGELVLAASLTKPPGEYEVTVTAVDASGDEGTFVIHVTLDPLPRVPAGGAKPPVVLLNGFQICTISSTLAETFGNLGEELLRDGVPQVYWFDNCVQDPNGSIETLGDSLGRALAQIRDDSGAALPQFDLIGHSMGGLIIRSYLAGLQVGGSLYTPVDHRVRKVVQIATPNFGAYKALPLGKQMTAMIPGSSFLWNLARWNQGRDDLRGVDALAIIGNGGYLGGLPKNAGDGVVSVWSASLGFTRGPERTRVLPYCHSDFNALHQLVADCVGQGIAKAPETARIIRSFLADTTEWLDPGLSTPQTQDPWLSSYGGLYLSYSTASNQPVNDLASASFGSVHLQVGGEAGAIYYSEGVSGTGSLQIASRSLGQFNCGTFTVPAGYFAALRCKSLPYISGVGPLLSSVRGQVVESGRNIAVSGLGFGQQCLTCRVTAENPAAANLQVVSWSDQAITAYLPFTYAGILRLSVSAASGQDSITLFAQPAIPPLLSISKTHTGAFTQGQTGATYSVVVSNAAAAGSTSGLVTVTESVPVGLTLGSLSGAGWNCSGVSCTRSDALGPGVSYPPITITCSVASDAPTQVTNRVTVIGGGANSAVAADATTILPGQNSQTPAIVSLNPANAIVQGSAFTLTVTGTNFLSGAVARWTQSGKTTDLVTQTATASTLIAQVSAQLLTAAGTALVTVSNPGGQTSAAAAFTISASAQGFSNRYLLSQVADGGGWRTTFSLINPSKAAVGYQLQLKTNQAAPFFITAGDRTASAFSGTLAPGASATLTSSDPANLTQGIAQADASAPVVLSGIFTNRVPGRPDYEAAVPALSAPLRTLVLPFDNQQGKATGVAIANTGEAGTPISLEFRDETGAVIHWGTLSLGSGEKTEFSLTDRFPAVRDQRGVVLISSDAPVLVALGLRFLPGGTFTSLPVHSPDSSTPMITRQVLSHVVDGSGWASTITLVNLDPQVAGYQLKLYDEAGKPMSLPLGTAANSIFSGTIAPLSSITLVTPGTANLLTQGWAELTSTRRIRAQLIFTQSIPGKPTFEAAAPALADGSTALVMPFDNTNGLVTGIAVANSGGAATTLLLGVRDETGLAIETKPINLGAGEKIVFELIKHAPDSAGKRGLVALSSSSSSIAVLALRFNGLAFTTLPVVPLDSSTNSPQ